MNMSKRKRAAIKIAALLIVFALLNSSVYQDASAEYYLDSLGHVTDDIVDRRESPDEDVLSELDNKYDISAGIDVSEEDDREYYIYKHINALHEEIREKHNKNENEHLAVFENITRLPGISLAGYFSPGFRLFLQSFPNYGDSTDRPFDTNFLGNGTSLQSVGGFGLVSQTGSNIYRDEGNLTEAEEMFHVEHFSEENENVPRGTFDEEDELKASLDDGGEAANGNGISSDDLPGTNEEENQNNYSDEDNGDNINSSDGAPSSEDINELGDEDEYADEVDGNDGGNFADDDDDNNGNNNNDNNAIDDYGDDNGDDTSLQQDDPFQGTNNPQTSDDFSLNGLIISTMGFVFSVGGLFYSYINREKYLDEEAGINAEINSEFYS